MGGPVGGVPFNQFPQTLLVLQGFLFASRLTRLLLLPAPPGQCVEGEKPGQRGGRLAPACIRGDFVDWRPQQGALTQIPGLRFT